MARVIEALKSARPRPEATLPLPAEPKPAAPPPQQPNVPQTDPAPLADEPPSRPDSGPRAASALPTPHEESAPDETEEFPFIEVGPNRQIEASPEVLAFRPHPPHAIPLVPAPVAKSVSPKRAATAPPAVTFQPWPCPDDSAPKPRLAGELIVFHQPDHPFSRQYVQLRDQVLADTGKQVYLFTAPSAEEGTTTVLLNLALAVCCDPEKKVVVVDKNWKDPMLADRLGLPSAPGLQEVLSGSVALEQALHPTPLPNLQALPAGEIKPHDGGPATSEALRWIVRWLAGRYDYVFLDTPPWEPGPVFEALLTISDVVVPVVCDAKTSQHQLHQMIQEITTAGGKVCGVIHSNPDAR